MRPWYFPMWVRGASPVQSPIAYSHPPETPAARSARSTRKPAELAVVTPARGQIVTLGESGCRVQLARDRLRGARRPPRRSQNVAWPQKRLGRHATPVRALSANQLSFHHGHPEAAVSQAASSVFAGRPGADHQHVVCVGHG